MSRSRETKIFVGNLPKDIKERELDDVFYKYGKIRDIQVKGLRGNSPFAFIEFDDHRDAKDAVKYRDGYDYDGYRLRVEFIKGAPHDSRGRNDDRYGSRSKESYRRPNVPIRTEYRVFVSNLPPTGSWQDIKDHCRKVGEAVYAEVYKDGTGILEFSNSEDMKKTVKELDGSKFKSHQGEVATVRLRISDSGRKRSRSRSYSSSSRSGSRSERSVSDRKRKSPKIKRNSDDGWSKSKSSRSSSPVSKKEKVSSRSRSRSISTDNNKNDSIISEKEIKGDDHKESAVNE